MNYSRATCPSSLVVVFVMLAVGACTGQPTPNRVDTAPGAVVPPIPSAETSVRVCGHVRLPGGLELTYLGMFSPDAVFHRGSRTFARNGRVTGEGILPALAHSPTDVHDEVPAWMLLSAERIVIDVEPPGHATAIAQVHSLPATMRNHFMTFAYARPSVISAPQHVVTDSQHRVIISDPSESAVHVLDPHGATSFRILGGKGFRLREPAGVAVDADDNIYVSDPIRGVVDVFDRNGNFLRYLGTYRGEPEFAHPAGIAIDSRSQRLFVVDQGANILFVLDLFGRVVRRVGRSRGGDNTDDFDHPTDIAVNHEHIFVLDRWGTRLQILDLSLNPLRSVDITAGRDPELYRNNGLSTDQQGHIYISLARSSLVSVYQPDGGLLATFGQYGTSVGQFAGPSGLWIDPRNDLYVADSGNGRVQMFQLQGGK
jgi:DNA-binding beta-propeller fold protein YncE